MLLVGVGVPDDPFPRVDSFVGDGVPDIPFGRQ